MARYFEGIGRRKSSVARVRLSEGTGAFVVNEKEIKDYFDRGGDDLIIMDVFNVTGMDSSRYDVSVRVKGGGTTGQTGSVLLGLARAFISMNPELQPALRQAGYVTRDSREKERKKPGLKRARKAPTYTKR
jgi:small subunit ribosomal protein S9